MDTERIDGRGAGASGEAGFTLAEFMMATLILLVLSGAMFGMLGETERAASYQTEVQAVLDNTRIAMETVEHIIRQAGNNPQAASGIAGVTVVSATEVTIQSDLTGSYSSEKGDPDGSIDDSGENLTIRYNATNRTIDVVAGGSTQAIASYISAFSMQYFDAAGAATTVGDDVRKIAVTITGSSTLPDPQTHQVFGIRLRSDLQIANRQ